MPRRKRFVGVQLQSSEAVGSSSCHSDASPSAHHAKASPSAHQAEASPIVHHSKASPSVSVLHDPPMADEHITDDIQI